MARGKDAHQARLAALNGLGRHLARRSRSTCELCDASGVSLYPFEVTPLADEPDLEETAFICTLCADGVSGGPLEGPRWRYLESAVWSEVRPVQVLAVRLARRLADAGQVWAVDLLGGLYLDESVSARVDQG
jgi:protein PhnA